MIYKGIVTKFLSQKVVGYQHDIDRSYTIFERECETKDDGVVRLWTRTYYSIAVGLSGVDNNLYTECPKIDVPA